MLIDGRCSEAVELLDRLEPAVRHLDGRRLYAAKHGGRNQLAAT